MPGSERAGSSATPGAARSSQLLCGKRAWHVPRKIVWTPTLLEWARAEEHGFTLHSVEERAPGDLVLFSFGNHEREVNHVGLLDLDSRHTIEGNTTVDGCGDETMGGVVARRDRQGVGVIGCARPSWR